MKILAIADEVDQRLYGPVLRQRFSDTSLVLSCGDLPIYYLEFIVSTLNVPLLYVRGNHASDQVSSSGEVKHAPEGCIDIDGRVVKEKGLLIAGLEGSMRYNDGPVQYTDSEMWVRALKLFPRLYLNRMNMGRYLDILVTHAPPFGIQDAEDVCHRGFRAFVYLIERFSPRYMLHGHIHVYTPSVITETQHHDTLVLNAFRFREIDIPEDTLLP